MCKLEILTKQIEGLIKTVSEALENGSKFSDKEKKGQYAVVYLGGYGKSAQIYTKDTGGGFSGSLYCKITF